MVSNNDDKVLIITLRMLIADDPIITTDTPEFTKIGSQLGEKKILLCKVKANPPATIIWIDPNTGNLITDDVGGDGTTESLLTIQVNLIGKKYMCAATNIMGKDNQDYQILSKGKLLQRL